MGWVVMFLINPCQEICWWQGGLAGPDRGCEFGRAEPHGRLRAGWELGMLQGSARAAGIGAGIIPLGTGMLEGSGVGDKGGHRI